MIDINTPDFNKTNSYLEKLERFDPTPMLDRAGMLGVQALSSSTPVDTGEAASSWDYHLEIKGDIYKLIWTNSDIAGQTPLVILLQYGHMTKNGYFLSGIDFINPALVPVYHILDSDLRREVFR